MTLNISTYTDPGAYFGEVIVPGTVSLATVPFVVCLIGIANRNKRVPNEAVTRGLVSEETLVVNATVSAHDATLAHYSNRQTAQTDILRDDVAIDSSEWSFQSAWLQSKDISANVNMGTRNKIGLSLDGKQMLTIMVQGNIVADLVREIPNESLVYCSLLSIGAGIAAVTPAQLAEAVNKSLTAATTFGYGPSYGAVASIAAVKYVRITSPVSTPISDVKIALAHPTAKDATSSEIFATGTSGTAAIPALTVGAPIFQAKTVARISNDEYSALSVYKANYVASDVDADSLENTNIQDLVRVGAFANATTYIESIDYTLNTSTIDWSVDTAATFTGSQVENFNLSTNGVVTIALDGKAAVEMPIVASTSNNLLTAPLASMVRAGGVVTVTVAHSYVIGEHVYNTVNEADFPLGEKIVSAIVAGVSFAYVEAGAAPGAQAAPHYFAQIPPSYVQPANAAAVTAAEVAVNINAYLAYDDVYGPKYRNIASTSGGKVVLTSPTEGTGSLVEINAPSAHSAVSVLFGLVAAQLPYETRGVGAVPADGAIYFATYEYTRPTADYNVPKRFYTPDSLVADVGFPTSTNQLAIGGQICFENLAPSMMVVQVNDVTFPGHPVQSEILAALNAAGTTSTATDIVVFSTNVNVQGDLIAHLVNQNSPTNKNYRRGWFGMARGTAIGDRDTPDTFVYRAVRTLQVPTDSPARGRMILAAPSDVTRTITLESGTLQDLELDSTYLATAIAARMTAFTSPSETLLRKTVSGFVGDDFPTYLKAERATLASNGVTVVTYDAGLFKLLDPISTEAGVGRLVQFSEISASLQKDATNVAVTEIVDANLIGVVPNSVANFLSTIKMYVASALRALIASGAIAPFKTADGTTRDVDLTKDIQAAQDLTDPTKYLVKYWYNLRLPCKRVMGEFSVNGSFF